MVYCECNSCGWYRKIRGFRKDAPVKCLGGCDPGDVVIIPSEQSGKVKPLEALALGRIRVQFKPNSQ